MTRFLKNTFKEIRDLNRERKIIQDFIKVDPLSDPKTVRRFAKERIAERFMKDKLYDKLKVEDRRGKSDEAVVIIRFVHRVLNDKISDKEKEKLIEDFIKQTKVSKEYIQSLLDEVPEQIKKNRKKILEEEKLFAEKTRLLWIYVGILMALIILLSGVVVPLYIAGWVIAFGLIYRREKKKEGTGIPKISLFAMAGESSLSWLYVIFHVVRYFQKRSL
jgi:hypothetical protein